MFYYNKKIQFLLLYKFVNFGTILLFYYSIILLFYVVLFNICLFICRFVYMSICLYVDLFICRFIYVLICMHLINQYLLRCRGQVENLPFQHEIHQLNNLL